MHTERLESAARLDIHNITSDIMACLATLQKESTKENWEIIKHYDMALTTTSLSKAARRKELRVILSLSRINNGKSWKKMGKKDVEMLVYDIMNRYSPDGQETWTTYNHKRELKIFLRWVKLGTRDFYDVGDPIESKWIRVKNPKETLAREDLISDIDRINMLAATSDLQSKALIDVTDEAGLRIGELLTLGIKNIVFDENGAMISVDGKTGARRVRLIRSSKNLLNWYNSHPLKEKRESPLFIAKRKGHFGKRLSYASAMLIIKRAARDAKIDKKITFQIERHSGATNSAKILNEAQMRHRHGWTKSSPMPARYVHLVGADVDNAILKHYGLKSDNVEPTVKKCSFCSTINTGDVDTCENCEKPLDLKTAIEKDIKTNEIVERLEQKIDEKDKKMEEMEIRFQKQIDDVLSSLHKQNPDR